MKLPIKIITAGITALLSGCTGFSLTTQPTAITKATLLPLEKPLWQVEDESFSPSSPRLIDITNDGILDVIQGDIGNNGNSYVSARDGKSGQEIWRRSGFTDLFTSAVFIHINNDNIPDIIMGGRSKELIAINGINGELLWQFDPSLEQNLWGNFYSSQVIPDQNNDGINDLLTTNGGDQANNDNRQPGQLLIISGSTGQIIYQLSSPDGRETYMSPVIIYPPNANEPTILFGTGGETLPGGLWKISLTDLQNQNKSGFIKLLGSDTKGFEAPPSIADFNNDQIFDYLAQGFDGTVSLVDGKTSEILWQVKNENHESIAMPTLGYFVGNDDIPDVFIHINRGVFPEWRATDYLLLDGRNGNIAWQKSMGSYTPSGSVAIDLNGDMIDEIIFAVNQFDNNAPVRRTELYVLDTSSGQAILWNNINRFTVAAPWVGDIDNNGLIDIITEGNIQTNPDTHDSDSETPSLVRYELDYRMPEKVSWGAYMGTRYNGILNK